MNTLVGLTGACRSWHGTVVEFDDTRGVYRFQPDGSSHTFRMWPAEFVAD